MQIRSRIQLARSATLIALLLTAPPLVRGARAQTQYGAQQRADAASQMIVLGVQQGISSLPPTSGQSFVYDYDAELGTFRESEALGPTVLRATQTIGANKLSLRFATSYFDLSKTLSAIPYQVTGPTIPDCTGDPDLCFHTKLGMKASANVVAFNAGATYGITDRIELTLNVPFSVVDANASQIITTAPPPFPPANQADIIAVQGTVATLNEAIATNVVALRTIGFPPLGADFNGGTHAGLGRISVGGKGVVFANDLAEVAVAADFFCNSPSQDEFAGSDSAAILPRVIGQVKPIKYLRLLADVGYDYDFQVGELRRFVWNTGVSVPLSIVTLDAGMGGSLYDDAIRWTPVVASGVNADGAPITATAVNPSSTQLGTNYVAFLFGVKVRLLKGTVLAGAVSVPVTNEGFQAAAIGTLALEYYF